MTIMLVTAVLLGLAVLFGSIAALLVVSPDFSAEACRQGDPAARLVPQRAPRRVTSAEATKRRAA